MARKLKNAQVVYKGCWATRTDLVDRTETVPANVNINGAVVVINVIVRTKVAQESRVPVLLKLTLPAGTRVNTWPKNGEKKARSDRALVGTIVDRQGRRYAEAFSKYRPAFVYRAGDVADPGTFDPSAVTECSGGIHFYRAPKKAWEWVGVLA